MYWDFHEMIILGCGSDGYHASRRSLAIFAIRFFSMSGWCGITQNNLLSASSDFSLWCFLIPGTRPKISLIKGEGKSFSCNRRTKFLRASSKYFCCEQRLNNRMVSPMGQDWWTREVCALWCDKGNFWDVAFVWSFHSMLRVAMKSFSIIRVRSKVVISPSPSRSCSFSNSYPHWVACHAKYGKACAHSAFWTQMTSSLNLPYNKMPNRARASSLNAVFSQLHLGTLRH